jgi:hypothetical protein
MAHLEKNGHILLGEPGRQTGDLFLPWIEARGWQVTQGLEPIEGRPKPIRILELTRNQ